jgi:hypothetical protein
MRTSKLPSIVMGRLLKPLAAAFGAGTMAAGFDARIDSGFAYTFSSRPQGRRYRKGVVVDGHAQYDASRYRCY